MIDLHTHILPGVDDGVQRVEDALLMAEDAAEQGVTLMVATPHLFWSGRDALSAAQIREEVEQLNALIEAKGIPLRVLPGCEIPLAADLSARLERGEWMPLGGETRLVLVEPPWHEWHAWSGAVLHSLIESGWTVVLAHPERNSIFQRNLALLEELVAINVHLQVTAGSLILGRSSPRTARCAYDLLERQLVSVVASDCHNATHRRCDMREAYQTLQRAFGRHVAKMLTTTVPQALLRGEKVDVAQVWQKGAADQSRWKRFLRAVLRRETDDG